MRILVVEDEPILADAVTAALRAEAYAVDRAAEAGYADELMAVNRYDCVILDWSLPDGSGLELLAGWRDGGRHVPVLMLTGRQALEDRVTGLDAGADDYLTKPFSLAEMLARVRSLLRRRTRRLLRELRAGDVVMDRAARRVAVGGEPVALTAKEFALLEYFLRRVDEVVTRGELVEHVWDDDFDSLSNVIDATVYKLRKKLGRDGAGRRLETVKGVGYVLKSELP